MKAVILAGGRGSRISEETVLRPKPLVEIGGRPILWHIMKIYSAYGITDFIVCLGYKGYMIKEYFANYFLHSADLTIDLANDKLDFHRSSCEPWRVTLVETGMDTMTGGRIKRILPYVENDKMFCLTYGDGVANVDISKLTEFHASHGKLVTLTATQPTGRFGGLNLERGTDVVSFAEKPKGDDRWVNGGFFVLSPKIGEYIEGDESIWEREPLERLSRGGQVAAFKHPGFWQPMDTVHDRTALEEIWNSGNAPWRIW